MGKAATGEARDRLRGARQRLLLLRRAGETAADLRFTRPGTDRPCFPQVAEAYSVAAAAGRPPRRLRLGSLHLADGSEPDADLRPASAWPGVFRGDHSRQPGPGAAGPRTVDLRPDCYEEDPGRV